MWKEYGHILDSANLRISCISSLPTDTVVSAVIDANYSVKVTATKAFTPKLLTRRLAMPEVK